MRAADAVATLPAASRLTSGTVVASLREVARLAVAEARRIDTVAAWPPASLTLAEPRTTTTFALLTFGL